MFYPSSIWSLLCQCLFCAFYIKLSNANRYSAIITLLSWFFSLMYVSCFSRNGTPRQPLLVPLARARLKFDAARVPSASLEGLEGYSHCWILYVFHLNTDLEKLWKHPSQSKFKAKVLYYEFILFCLH